MVGDPRRAKRSLYPEPLGDVDLAAVDAPHELANRVDLEAAILELGDELQALPVRLLIERDAADELRGRKQSLRLVEANGATRYARERREVVDGERVGLRRREVAVVIVVRGALGGFVHASCGHSVEKRTHNAPASASGAGARRREGSASRKMRFTTVPNCFQKPPVL